MRNTENSKSTEVNGNWKGPKLQGNFCDFAAHCWGKHWP